MAWDIASRTVLITGAARGIGAEAARQLHARGANLALVDRDAETLAALAAALGDRALALPADVTDEPAMRRAVAAAVQRFGALDVAVANAGVHATGALTEAPLAQLQRELDVNLGGALRTLRAAAPAVVARQGYLLSVASLAVALHAPLVGAYAASKAGLEALTDTLRVELAPTGTSVGCAYFAFVETPILAVPETGPVQAPLDRRLPAAVRTALPVTDAGAVLVRAIAERRSRVWAPRYVGAALALRGVLQPALERRMARRYAGRV